MNIPNGLSSAWPPPVGTATHRGLTKTEQRVLWLRHRLFSRWPSLLLREFKQAWRGGWNIVAYIALALWLLGCSAPPLVGYHGIAIHVVRFPRYADTTYWCQFEYGTLCEYGGKSGVLRYTTGGWIPEGGEIIR